MYLYCTGLEQLLQFCTGCSTVKGNSIVVRFDDDKGASAIVSHTCSRELVLSTHISDRKMFKAALSSVIQENTFTML